MKNRVTRPFSVNFAIFLYGILAFKSWLDVNSKNSESIETLIPLALAIPLNFIFISLLSDSKFGRISALILSVFLALLWLVYLLILLGSSETLYFQLWVAASLWIFYMFWLVSYAFGRKARAYYADKIKEKIKQNN